MLKRRREYDRQSRATMASEEALRRQREWKRSQSIVVQRR